MARPETRKKPWRTVNDQGFSTNVGFGDSTKATVPPLQDPELLTTRELSERLGVKPVWIAKQRHRNEDFPPPAGQAAPYVTATLLWHPDAVSEIEAWRKQDRRSTPPIERFLTRVKWSKTSFLDHGDGVVTRCLEWTGGENGKGYGEFYDGSRMTTSHKFFYVYMFGPVPRRNIEGKLLHLDHLCRHTLCCWPGHLELVTARKNFERGEAPTWIAYRNNRCMADLHDLIGDNVYVDPSTGARRCIACRRATRRVRYLAQNS